MPKLSVLLDFDGTITMRDLGDQIIDQFGLPGRPDTSDRFRRGELSLRELWAIEMERLQESQLVEMTEFAKNEAVTRPGLIELITFCRERKIPVEVASSGLKFYIEAVLNRSGLGDLPISAPSMAFDERGLGELAFDEGLRDCSMTAMCKCEQVWRQRRLGRKVLFIGDGASDNCAASQADFLMARDALARHCDRENVSYVPFEDFHQTIEYVGEILGRD